MPLEQLHDTHPAVPWGNARPIRAEANCLLEIRDRLVHRAGQKLAPADMGISRHPAAIERIGVIGRTTRLCDRELPLERAGNARRNLVLHGEQIADVAVEALGPEMRAGLGVDQLDVDPDLMAGSLNTAFQNIADAQLAADLLGVDR